MDEQARACLTEEQLTPVLSIDILPHFGGHPMAAGMTLPLEHVDELRTRFIGIFIKEVFQHNCAHFLRNVPSYINGSYCRRTIDTTKTVVDGIKGTTDRTKTAVENLNNKQDSLLQKFKM